MNQKDGSCPFCGASLNPSSSTCPSCRRNVFPSSLEYSDRYKLKTRPQSIALTPKNLVIGGIVVLLIAVAPIIIFLNLSRNGSNPSAQITTPPTSSTFSTPFSTSAPTATPVTPATGSQAEAWIGALTQGSTTYYVELHITSFAQTAAFQGKWCADMTNKTDLYGHSVCTDSVSISGTWVAFSSLGPGLQADINSKYPNTIHDTIIIWSGEGDASGSLCQDCRYYSFIQNNDLKGLWYFASSSTSDGMFSITLQGGGKSKLGS